MKILLTNDDGIHSPGLEALVDALKNHEIWIAAPDKERSASSHSITIKDPVRFHQTGERSFACGGTPADCVLFSLRGALPIRPDLIISGINLGANLGIDLLYSGTAAAARQGALMGVPSIAASQCSYSPPFFFSRGAEFLAANLEVLISLWHPDHFININIPNRETGTLEPRITIPGRSSYQDVLTTMKGPYGDSFHFLSGKREEEKGEGFDTQAVEAGFVSISPVFLFPMNHREEEAYRRAAFRSLS